jgi:hypothetical protein
MVPKANAQQAATLPKLQYTCINVGRLYTDGLSEKGQSTRRRELGASRQPRRRRPLFQATDDVSDRSLASEAVGAAARIPCGAAARVQEARALFLPICGATYRLAFVQRGFRVSSSDGVPR